MDQQLRYEVIFAFHGLTGIHNVLKERVKTKKLAQSYKAMIDNTVRHAWMYDHVTGEKTVWKLEN